MNVESERVRVCVCVCLLCQVYYSRGVRGTLCVTIFVCVRVCFTCESL